MNVRVHVFIYGDVIGVGFRAWIKRNVEDLGLTGWVRNASQETVEAVFEGPKEKVEEMLKKCHRGPEIAWVERVDFKWEKVTGEFITFDICL
jgi:acylphosphatase